LLQSLSRPTNQMKAYPGLFKLSDEDYLGLNIRMLDYTYPGMFI